jgi:hypothetical protein
MKRWPLGFLLVLALSAHAESFWDGNAAVQRGDAAFEAGLNAVSNAFPFDTEIIIEDLATGKTTTARVTGRLDEPLDILVLLSPAAALPLGLVPGDIVRVRVTVKRSPPAVAPILAEEAAPSTDIDRVAPVVRREDTIVETSEPSEEAPAEEPAVEAAVEAPAEEPVAEAPAEEPAVEAAVEAPAEEPVAEAPAEEPVAVEPGTSAEDAAFLAELAARTPQKQLFLPPREDEMFAYQEPVEPPAEAAVIEVVAQPEETAPTTVDVAAAEAPEIVSDAGPAEPSETAESIALAEAMPPEELWPELMETLAATAPGAAPVPEQPLAEPMAFAAEGAATAAPAAAAAMPAAVEPAPVQLVPVQPAPAAAVAAAPAARPAEPAPATAAARPAAVSTVLDLPGTGALVWYLQLAAYSSEVMARDTATRLSGTYPVLVLAPQAGSRPLYRVFVGPLNRAESGTLLAYFRYRGFPDAFVRTAQK